MTAPTSAEAARFELGGLVAVDQVAVLDQAGQVVLLCHPYTAGLWLTWYAAGPGGDRSWIEDNDYRVCRCRHLCLSHSSTRPDYTQAPGVGNGECGVDGCGCTEFALLIGPPKSPAGSR